MVITAYHRLHFIGSSQIQCTKAAVEYEMSLDEPAIKRVQSLFYDGDGTASNPLMGGFCQHRERGLFHMVLYRAGNFRTSFMEKKRCMLDSSKHCICCLLFTIGEIVMREVQTALTL